MAAQRPRCSVWHGSFRARPRNRHLSMEGDLHCLEVTTGRALEAEIHRNLKGVLCLEMGNPKVQVIPDRILEWEDLRIRCRLSSRLDHQRTNLTKGTGRFMVNWEVGGVGDKRCTELISLEANGGPDSRTECIQVGSDKGSTENRKVTKMLVLLLAYNHIATSRGTSPTLRPGLHSFARCGPRDPGFGYDHLKRCPCCGDLCIFKKLPQKHVFS